MGDLYYYLFSKRILRAGKIVGEHTVTVKSNLSTYFNVFRFPQFFNASPMAVAPLSPILLERSLRRKRKDVNNATKMIYIYVT